ncbi:DNA metabolism protein [Lithospermum erythrorhizon]|uniref:DNA metabolism protein n=1 Tax=Lithospermum erythrorhizon TaxID=34254 RepID=A0AAV3NPK1_LITER
MVDCGFARYKLVVLQHVGSDSEQESSDGSESCRKPSKRARGEVQPSASKVPESHVSSPPPNITNTYGILSLWKKKPSGGSRPRAVGKRTPRFPVSFSYENVRGEKYFSPNRQGLKMKGNNNEDEVAHEIALALAEASQRRGSPQASQTPNKITESIMSSPTRKSQRKYFDLEASRSKPASSDIDGEDLEGSTEADTGELSKGRTNLMESGNGSRLFQKERILSAKKLEVDENYENHLNEIKEACSGTEESQRLGAGRAKFETEVSDAKSSRSSLQGSRKRNKKILFSKDEESAVDALQTLADLSLMMPGAEEDESMMQVKDEFDDHMDESGSQEAIVRGHSRKKSSGKLRTSQTISRVELASPRTSKPGKISVQNNAELEGQLESNQSTLRRKKKKGIASKTRKSEVHVEDDQNEPRELEVRDVGKNWNKMRRPSQSTSPTVVKMLDDSVCNGPRREGSDSAQSSVQPFAVNQANLSTKIRSRRKSDLKVPQMLKEPKLGEKIVGDQINDHLNSLHDKAFGLKKILSNCLLNERAQKWCMYEWFYSAIDYPWFAKREFVEYLYHVGLGHVPRLTRVEWGVIRSSLGKPRRFSEHFLKEEKQKLNQYRESVRTHYTELRDGIRDGLPTDLAKPLSVGQRVIAIHPKTRELHDGSVLTVDRSRCRVQFDRPELGVEFVKDIHCMPLNPIENMPASLARHTVVVDKFFENLNELNLNGQVKEYIKCPPREALENVNGLSHLSPAAYGMGVLNQRKVGAADSITQDRVGVAESVANQHTSSPHPNAQAQIHAKEADVQALAELTRALDKKEAVVLELRRMNDDVSENQKDGNTSLQDSEPFKKQYAAVLVQLHEANEQVSSAIYCLRQRNTYQGHIPAALVKQNVNHMDQAGLINSFELVTGQSHESGSNIKEIIESSKTKARTMVDVAIQAMCALKVDENTVEKTEEAVDYVNDQITLDDSCMPTAPETKSRNVSDEKETEIPSELISQCVATLLMIQKCTEREFPPADVAQILDSAITGLQPCCSMNLSAYAEIQKCMGIIRNQILALIPT